MVSSKTNILDAYCMKLPSQQNAVDIFAGEWATQLPGDLVSGSIGLFHDHRTLKMQEALGSFNGMDVLELGPLEGGHTAQLHDLGVKSVLAIEANQRAYLKTLITKEIFGLDRAKVLLGDFNAYLETSDKKFDLILAAGVIYHMKNPVHTLGLILKNCDCVAIWSHYYSKRIQKEWYLTSRFKKKPEKLEGFGCTVDCHRHQYAEALDLAGFCGGGQDYSYWIPLEGWHKIFDHHGFELMILENNEEHPHGNAITAVGKRR